MAGHISVLGDDRRGPMHDRDVFGVGILDDQHTAGGECVQIFIPAYDMHRAEPDPRGGNQTPVDQDPRIGIAVSILPFFPSGTGDIFKGRVWRI